MDSVLSPMSTKVNLSNWRDYFVEEQYRPMQSDILDFISENYNKYKNFLINAPVGSGKSAIAYTLGRTLYANSKQGFNREPYQTYITTTTLQLQQQYMDSYEDKGLVTIQSAQNFICHKKNRTVLNCKESKELHGRMKKSCNDCLYDIARNKFLLAPCGVTNLSYYLYQTEYGFKNRPPERGLMIFDEGHKLADFVKDFITFQLSKRTIESFNLKVPPYRKDKSYKISELTEWIKTVYGVALRKELMQLEECLKSFENGDEDINPDNIPEYMKISRKIDTLKKTIEKFMGYVKEWNDLEWIAEWSNDKICVTPLSPKKYMNKLLFQKNKKNIIMSGTILDKDYIIEEYGLNPKETCFISKDLPFPKENRPILYHPCGKIKHDDLQESMKPFSKTVKVILDEHKNEKGIIFVTSYKQMDCVLKQVKDDRILSHVDSKSKAAILESHKTSDNTVLLSPSLNEGVDLKDDLSRFQVVLKMPFPNLETIAIKKRAELNPEWYAHETVLTLIQSTGRSIRNDKDTAVTYILCENFLWFYNKWKKFFPKWWRDAVHL